MTMIYTPMVIDLTWDGERRDMTWDGEVVDLSKDEGEVIDLSHEEEDARSDSGDTIPLEEDDDVPKDVLTRSPCIYIKIGTKEVAPV